MDTKRPTASELLEIISKISADEREAMIQHAATIGMIAGGWAAFEFSLDAYALSLAGISELGYCFTSQVIGPAKKVDAYIAVARERGGTKFMQELDAFAKDTAALGERRNRCVHDPWLRLGAEHPRRLEVTARRKLKREFVPVPREKLLALSIDIEKHQERFIDLHNRIMAAVGT